MDVLCNSADEQSRMMEVLIPLLAAAFFILTYSPTTSPQTHTVHIT